MKGLSKIFIGSVLLLLLVLPLSTVLAATEYKANTSMNVTVNFYISITPSSNLTKGIEFGGLDPGTSDNICTYCYSNPNSTANSTSLYLTVDSTTNSNVDFFHKSYSDLSTGGAEEDISIGNVTNEANQTQGGVNINSTATSDGSVELSTSFTEIGGSASSPCDSVGHDGNGNCYFSFWLDIPSGHDAGDFDTDYCFCGVQNGEGSGSCAC